MKTPLTGMFIIAATLLGGTIARADQIGSPERIEAVYEGIDASGRVVRLTITDLRVDTLTRLPAPGRPGHGEPHWSAFIGTGRASDAQARR